MTHRPRVLVAHEHAVLAEALATALAAGGRIEVIGHASDAREIELTALRTTPDVLLLRPLLPRGEGISLCRSVKTGSPSLKVVMAADRVEGTELLAAVEAGIDGYTTFGEDLDQVTDVLCRVHAGEVVIPPLLLGGLLHELIVQRRETAHAWDRLGRLSEREQEVLGCLVDGADQDTIAEQLFISVHTVRTHIQNILGKLGVHSRLEAVSLAVHAGWAAPIPAGGDR